MLAMLQMNETGKRLPWRFKGNWRNAEDLRWLNMEDWRLQRQEK
jgi:hypothetical protein